nr:hypothetical protein Ade03nite_87060 [Actinoplanes derwentensis]
MEFSGRVVDRQQAQSQEPMRAYGVAADRPGQLILQLTGPHILPLDRVLDGRDQHVETVLETGLIDPYDKFAGQSAVEREPNSAEVHDELAQRRFFARTALDEMSRDRNRPAVLILSAPEKSRQVDLHPALEDHDSVRTA